MRFIDFQKQLADYPVFSLRDIRKIIDSFSYRQLDRWKKKGYLKKIKRGFYCFPVKQINKNFLFYAANRIYSPSYISLEMALKHYSLIPEEIFQVTSVSAKKTENFSAGIGNFSYRHIKPALFFGYDLADLGQQKILMAEPEKAILDYLYLHPSLNTSSDFKEMRINADEFSSRINQEKLLKYLAAFKNKSLTKRLKIFLTAINNDKD